MSEQAFMFTLAVFTGLLCGIAAAILKTTIASVGQFVSTFYNSQGPYWILLLIPLAGIMLTGIYQRYVLKHDIEHGVHRMEMMIGQGNSIMPAYMIYAPVIASSLTLGFGGSAGSEGPIASTGAAIGSNVGRLFKVDARHIMILLGCGAGAGIAGIFKAPVGGALFTIEVLKLEMTTVSVVALLISCITSAMTAYVLSGCTVDISYLQMEQFDISIIPWVLMLGVVTGFYSLYYSDVMGIMARWFTSMKNPWIRNLVSGSILSVILLTFPAMYGEGYGLMTDLLNGHFGSVSQYGFFHDSHIGSVGFLAVVAGIAAMKAFAASSSNSGGGVAGDFAPTLFAGCMVGYLFAASLNMIFGLHLPESGFAFMGMAGVMAGAVRAPLMALFLTAEMTDGFILFLPLLGVSAISFAIVRLFRKESYYKEFS